MKHQLQLLLLHIQRQGPLLCFHFLLLRRPKGLLNMCLIDSDFKLFYTHLPRLENQLIAQAFRRCSKFLLELLHGVPKVAGTQNSR